MKDPPLHHFPVFSIVDDDDNVVIKHAQCNNCGIVHKVFDLCRSQILHGREAFAAVKSASDVAVGLPTELVKILEEHQADVSTYEQAAFIIDNERWGDFIVLSNDVEHDTRAVKYLRILGKGLLRVETTTVNEGF